MLKQKYRFHGHGSLRYVYRQGNAIRSLIKEQKSNVKIPYTAQGHILSEVIAGAVFGLLIGLVVFLATK